MARARLTAQEEAARAAAAEVQRQAELQGWAQRITRNVRPAHETPEGQEMVRVLRAAFAGYLVPRVRS